LTLGGHQSGTVFKFSQTCHEAKFSKAKYNACAPVNSLVFSDQSVYSQIVPSPFIFLKDYEDKIMKSAGLLLALLVVLVAATCVFGQGKGVDTQNKRISDNSASKGAANNGTKQDVGTTGSGINFGKDKTRVQPMLPNPYRLTSRRDVLIKAVTDVMRDRKLIVDDASSKPDEGIIVSQPYTFIKGAVVAQSELNRYANIVSDNTRGWTRGRYTITVEVQPIDGVSANVSVNAKIEGRTDGPTGAEWITLVSTGVAEQEFLTDLINAVTGGAPSTSKYRPSDFRLKFSLVVANTANKIISVDATPNSAVINANPKSTKSTGY
jgi:hypothetical protein